MVSGESSSSMALVRSSDVPPPQKMSAPSVSTSSVSSYASAGSRNEFVKPSDLNTRLAGLGTCTRLRPYIRLTPFGRPER